MAATVKNFRLSESALIERWALDYYLYLAYSNLKTSKCIPASLVHHLHGCVTHLQQCLENEEASQRIKQLVTVLLISLDKSKDLDDVYLHFKDQMGVTLLETCVEVVSHLRQLEGALNTLLSSELIVDLKRLAVCVCIVGKENKMAKDVFERQFSVNKTGTGTLAEGKVEQTLQRLLTSSLPRLDGYLTDVTVDSVIDMVCKWLGPWFNKFRTPYLCKAARNTILNIGEGESDSDNATPFNPALPTSTPRNNKTSKEQFVKSIQLAPSPPKEKDLVDSPPKLKSPVKTRRQVCEAIAVVEEAARALLPDTQDLRNNDSSTAEDMTPPRVSPKSRGSDRLDGGRSLSKSLGRREARSENRKSRVDRQEPGTSKDLDKVPRSADRVRVMKDRGDVNPVVALSPGRRGIRKLFTNTGAKFDDLADDTEEEDETQQPDTPPRPREKASTTIDKLQHKMRDKERSGTNGPAGEGSPRTVPKSPHHRLASITERRADQSPSRGSSSNGTNKNNNSPRRPTHDSEPSSSRYPTVVPKKPRLIPKPHRKRPAQPLADSSDDDEIDILMNESTTSTKPRGQPNKRRKWSWDESRNLLKGVLKCGDGQWATILQRFKFDDRTNVHLKDRWRVMLKNKDITELKLQYAVN